MSITSLIPPAGLALLGSHVRTMPDTSIKMYLRLHVHMLARSMMLVNGFDWDSANRLKNEKKHMEFLVNR